MDKIAIISDIHGNLEALNKVFDDINNRGITKIYCIGDIIAKGNHQNECVDLVRKKCDVIIKGNCDEYFAMDHDTEGKDDIESRRIRWVKSVVSKENLDYLSKLPFCYEFYLSGRLVRLLHGHPTSTKKFIGNVDYLDNLYTLFLPSENTISNLKADILVYGHIHTPYVQRIYNRTIINIGSVGNAIDVFRNPEKDGDERNTCLANYLILSGELDSKEYGSLSYEIVNIPYNIDKELSVSGNLEQEEYEEEIRHGKYRDMEKIYKSFIARGIDPNSI